MRHHKAARSRDVHLIALAARHDARDVTADLAIVATHSLPVNAVATTQRGRGESGDDCHLRPQLMTGWRQRTPRGVDRACRVLHRDKLGAARLYIDLGTPQRR